MSSYQRFHIDTADAPPVVPETDRFQVDIDPLEFARMVADVARDGRTPSRIREILGSRPCIYGVYDNFLGGLQAEDSLCRGCMRCMVEHPEVARIETNPAYRRLGDGYWEPEQVLTVWREATTGRVPVRGAAYDGPFKGPGFDAIWTDMSEIVRPTRDGIHGREFISTAVDLGRPPSRVRFPNPDGGTAPTDDGGPLVQLPLPILFDALTQESVGPGVQLALALAAEKTGTLAMLPSRDLTSLLRHAPEVRDAVGHVAPRLPADGAGADEVPSNRWPGDREPVSGLRMVILEAEHVSAGMDLHGKEGTVVCLRLPLGPDAPRRAVELTHRGAGCLHLYADYHGRGTEGGFVTDRTRAVHDRLVDTGLRQRVSLIVSGGVVMAEHVPKAIICGADAVAVDTAAVVALQSEFTGELRSPDGAELSVPEFESDWAVQRLVNLLGAWHSQLLEVLGAMGLREVRRLRGEVGRAIFADEVEEEVFGPLFGPDEANG